MEGPKTKDYPTLTSDAIPASSQLSVRAASAGRPTPLSVPSLDGAGGARINTSRGEFPSLPAGGLPKRHTLASLTGSSSKSQDHWRRPISADSNARNGGRMNDQEDRIHSGSAKSKKGKKTLLHFG